ncbi:hypothetical protein [Streptomyces sp. NPDC059256]|uniref:hypothetical protein n=1 Tax=unclassified Streptomyces TaxID=2593676 RepID=UPI0036CBF65B
MPGVTVDEPTTDRAVQCITVDAGLEVGEKTNEITCFQPLLDTVADWARSGAVRRPR